MTWKNCRTRSTYLFCVGLLLLFAGLWLWERGMYKSLMIVLWAAGGLVLAVRLWITFHFWKCPNCGRRLPLRATAETITRCPSCTFALKQTQSRKETMIWQKRRTHGSG